MCVSMLPLVCRPYMRTLYCSRESERPGGPSVRSRSDRVGGRGRACIMAERRTCIPNNEDNDKSTRRIRPRMCAEYPMHNIASLSAALPCTRTSVSDFGARPCLPSRLLACLPDRIYVVGASNCIPPLLVLPGYAGDALLA